MYMLSRTKIRPANCCRTSASKYLRVLRARNIFYQKYSNTVAAFFMSDDNVVKCLPIFITMFVLHINVTRPIPRYFLCNIPLQFQFLIINIYIGYLF